MVFAINTLKKKSNTMQISLLDQIHIPSILEESGLDDCKVCNFSIGNDNRIHLLLEKNTDQRGIGRFLAISFAVDWRNGGALFQEATDFGVPPLGVSYMQPLQDGFLLLAARSRYHGNDKGEKNAFITDANGVIQTSYCFGDGINQCIVDKRQRIITSYFDEGVFGNFGWKNPIGESGLIAWSPEGEQLWKNDRHDICDCYAVNIDNDENLWFYYYTDFNLVKTDYAGDWIFQPDISGSAGFLFHYNKRYALFDAGYDRHGEFAAKVFVDGGMRLSNAGPAEFLWNGSPITPKNFSFRASKALLWDSADNLYYTEWREDTTFPR